MQNNKFKNIFIGASVALLCAAIIIYSIEFAKSFLQIGLGFFLFIFPFTFLSLFTSKIGSFIFIFITTIITYIVSRHLFNDFWLGVILAGIIGGSAFYFRINRIKLFSPSDYKNKAKT
ncbi:MAG: hypothetical protein ACOYOV_12420 [Bacteroidales bacterium]